MEADPIKLAEMKEKIKKEYPRRTRKLLETKLHSKSLIKGINSWAFLLVRYSGLFLKWTREKLQQIDQRTRKLMTMHKTVHTREMKSEKKKKEDTPASKKASILRYNDKNITLKSSGED